MPKGNSGKIEKQKRKMFSDIDKVRTILPTGRFDSTEPCILYPDSCESYKKLKCKGYGVFTVKVKGNAKSKSGGCIEKVTLKTDDSSPATIGEPDGRPCGHYEIFCPVYRKTRPRQCEKGLGEIVSMNGPRKRKSSAYDPKTCASWDANAHSEKRK